MARVSDDRRQNDTSQTHGQVKTCGRMPKGEAAGETASRSLVPSGPSAPAKRAVQESGPIRCRRSGDTRCQGVPPAELQTPCFDGQGRKAMQERFGRAPCQSNDYRRALST